MPRRKGDDINFIEFQLFRIARFLESLVRKVDEVAEGQGAINSAISDVQGKADALKASVDAAVTAITGVVTKLQGAANAPDFTTEVQTLQGISDELSGASSALGTATDEADSAAGIGGGAAAPEAGQSGEAPPPTEPPPTGQ